jgi:hypothetical protein
LKRNAVVLALGAALLSGGCAGDQAATSTPSLAATESAEPTVETSTTTDQSSSGTGPSTIPLGSIASDTPEPSLDLATYTIFCYRVGPNHVYEWLSSQPADDIVEAPLSAESIADLVQTEDACNSASEGWVEEGESQYAEVLADLAEAARAFAECGVSMVGDCPVELVDFEQTVLRAGRILDGDPDLATAGTNVSSPPATGSSPPSPSTTAPPSVFQSQSDAGTQLAQELADAFAESNWAAVRQLSPTNPLTDAQLTEGYGGLDELTLVLGGSRAIDSKTIVLYLMQVAHETRPTGPQTSLYCVRWDYHADTQTIVQQAGELLSRDDGTIPVSESLRGAFICEGFETAEGSPTPTTETHPQRVGPQPERPPGLPDQWEVVAFEGNSYLCSRTIGLYGTFRCELFTGEVPLDIVEPDLLCTDRGNLWFDCSDEGILPSELDAYELSLFGTERLLCQFTDCWSWAAGDSVSFATLGPPDYRCADTDCEVFAP